MKVLILYLPILFFILSGMLFGCDRLDDDYSTDPSYRISFSKDTISFDTIFTTIGSATKEFMVYNMNNQPLNIENILLSSSEQSKKSGFRINVDGHKGDRFDNIRISKNDSLYVFVEVTVNPNDNKEQLFIQDSIIFSFNGIQQKVFLEACGKNVEIIKGEMILNKDTTFSSKRPYLIYDSIMIKNGVTVNIEKGTIFYMHDKSKIISNGTILANGTIEEPIIFRGDRLDDIIENELPYDRAPGQWGGFVFQSESFGNVLDHVIVRNVTTGIKCDPSNPNQPKLLINNSQITNAIKDVLIAYNCNIEVLNSELSNATNNVVSLMGGKYYFAHCTIVNYMTLKSRKDSRTLYISQNLTAPIIQAYFDNCIIEGNHNPSKNLEDPSDDKNKEGSGEIKISPRPNDLDFNYRFNHCVMKLDKINDDRLIDIIFINNKDKMDYIKKGNKENKYEFDFRPNNDTIPGMNRADLFISNKYPTDRYGNNRINTSKPDIGAYEYVKYTSE